MYNRIFHKHYIFQYKAKGGFFMTDHSKVIQTQDDSPVDAVINVTLSENLLEAYIQFEPPKNGGEPVTMDRVMQEISNKKVVFGINEQLLKILVDKPEYYTDTTFAKAKPPKDSVNGAITWHVESNTSLKPKENPDGSIDLRELGKVKNVTKGQVLCTINKQNDGDEGITVTGSRIAPTIAKKVPALLGKNVVFNEDETQIIADADGQLSIIANKVSVEQTLVINGDIDHSTGNVNFVGNVQIRGGVQAGFIVEARGTIDIAGFVEAATIKAGGDITLHCGMNGGSKGYIECGGNLNCTFLEFCDILVNGDLNTQYLLQCQIKVGGNIDLVGKKASIVGGNCLVGGNITSKTIGNQYGIKTEIILGASHTLIDRQRELNKEIPELSTKIDNLSKIINMLSPLHEANRLPAERISMLENANLSIVIYTNKLEEIKSELAIIDEEVQARTNGKILCNDTIHSGTMVTIGFAKYLVDRPLKFSSMYYSDGEIVIGSM
jgi:uncharacterized protein (DUF342 family)